MPRTPQPERRAPGGAEATVLARMRRAGWWKGAEEPQMQPSARHSAQGPPGLDMRQGFLTEEHSYLNQDKVSYVPGCFSLSF